MKKLIAVVLVFAMMLMLVPGIAEETQSVSAMNAHIRWR